MENCFTCWLHNGDKCGMTPPCYAKRQEWIVNVEPPRDEDTEEEKQEEK